MHLCSYFHEVRILLRIRNRCVVVSRLTFGLLRRFRRTTTRLRGSVLLGAFCGRLCAQPRKWVRGSGAEQLVSEEEWLVLTLIITQVHVRELILRRFKSH